ncbi:MAG: RNA polymerase sigma factor [Chthoniobacterales bacterium]
MLIYLAALAAPIYDRSMAALDFEKLVEDYYMPLYRFAFSLSRQESDAADLTQQTFLLWASKGHQLRDLSKVKTWLFTSLYREFLGRKRQQDRFVDSENTAEVMAAQSISASVVNQLDGDIVQRALLALEEIYRAPLTLFYLQQLSYKEISEALEIPIGTVMSRISRGKAQLRKALADSARPTNEESEGAAYD